VATGFCVNYTRRPGVRKVSLLAIPVFLASVVSILSLQENMLLLYLCPADTSLEQYVSTWSSSADLSPDPLPGKRVFLGQTFG